MTTPTEYTGFFREWWESRFVDSCLVKRPSNQTFTESTGTYTVSYSTTYSGVCLVRPAGAGDEQSGEQQAEIRFYNVHVPYSVTTAQVDDLVDVTGTFDSYLTGKQFVVRNVSGDTYNHKRTLYCEEVVNG